jgi:spermidine synthase
MIKTSSAVAVQSEQSTSGFFVLAGVGLSSLSALLLELSLTRLFSVVLFYHFAFLAISIALLGLGAGGVFAYVAKRGLSQYETRPLMARLCFANAVLIPVVLEIVLHVPVSLELAPANFLRLTAMYLASALPFFFTGLQFSILFARLHENITRLYGADLAGGAAACMATVPLLNHLGGPNTILFAGVLAAVAGVVWSLDAGVKKICAGFALALLALIAANHSGNLIDVIYAKGMFRDKSWVEFARWNAISRVEVDQQGSNGKAVVIDADASTYIMNADLAQWQDSVWQKNLMSAPPAVANVLRPHGDYAIIGPGGGVDVLRAVANGSPSVTGIEINPIIANTIMRDKYADYAHHLYELPNVHIHVRDGRSYLRSTQERFDVVQMTLVDTWASTAAGAFALSENNLYTVQAFREYFDHLRPDGLIAITRWEFRQPREALRVVSVAMEALHELGVANPAAHFIVISQGELDEDGIPVAVLAKKTPFTAEEQSLVQEYLKSHPSLAALYLPSSARDNPFTRLIAGNDPYAFARSYAYNVTPVKDNAPFFFFTLKPEELLHHHGMESAIDWKVNLGVAVLGMVLIISVVAVVAFLLFPLLIRTGGAHESATSLLYFVAVGLAYMMVEIAFIQRFVLFLGHPTYALTVVVFLLLLSSGTGSLISRTWLRRSRSIWRPLALTIALLIAYVFVLPKGLASLVGLPFGLKLLISAVILVPLGFLMGMPFPTGLRALANLAQSISSSVRSNAVEWAWAMNAASSVLGSVLAIVIAIQFGLNVTLACGAAFYLLALLFMRPLFPNITGEPRP